MAFIYQALSFVFLFFTPLAAYAHEVYVLPQDMIDAALQAPTLSSLDVIIANLGLFVFWAFIGIVLVVFIFSISISRGLEKRLDPMLIRLKKYAPFVARITAGLAFLACGYYGALFGPELPLESLFYGFAPAVQVLLFVIGTLILVGKWVRAAALVALALFAVAVYQHGFYMLTYTNYLGEIIVLLLIGAHRVALEGKPEAPVPQNIIQHIGTTLRPYSFFLLRVAFGVSLLYASVYAKFLHNTLALNVAALPWAGHTTSLASVFGFTPEFLVLGAGIVEIVIGLFFLLGIEIRFTALFLEFWLALSLIYFGEIVWPHLILIGIPIAFFLYGYEKYSLEGHFFKKGNREPVF